ncbi:2-hydroxyacid dehydrogenase [Desulfohalovibrio reitneri]|uniref:2-hydroxyacid dehydrogenase n=1 Tax=Desulfohalovibrio reitneri TaxID=1307759 RepID=UPI0004A7157A|nr:2-hydroxyacid dehydrogenase [Desulfohalovibrio reitneri]
MRIAFFSTKSHDRDFFDQANQEFDHQLDYFEPRLLPETARLAEGYEGVCCFVNDRLDADILQTLHGGGTRLVALRCAGFNNVDLTKAGELGMTVMRVPDYSPHAVAEHTVGLVLALDRKIHRSFNRVREKNFSLEGLLGFDLHGKTVGVIGTGKIGTVMCRIMRGFGCSVLAHSRSERDDVKDMGVGYVPLKDLLSRSDIVSLHLPLTPKTHHLVDEKALSGMKRGAMLVNTSRGKLVDTEAAIEALKSGSLGGMAIDVYEEESDIFYQDLSGKVIDDDLLTRLLIMPNVIVTGHQAFFTEEAMESISRITLQNISDFEAGKAEDSGNTVSAEKHTK